MIGRPFLGSLRGFYEEDNHFGDLDFLGAGVRTFLARVKQFLLFLSFFLF